MFASAVVMAAILTARGPPTVLWNPGIDYEIRIQNNNGRITWESTSTLNGRGTQLIKPPQGSYDAPTSRRYHAGTVPNRAVAPRSMGPYRGGYH